MPKICKTCHETKDESDFSSIFNRRSGTRWYYSVCKPCRAAAARQKRACNREKARAIGLASYYRHRAIRLLDMADYRAAHPEYFVKKRKEYAQQFPEKMRAKGAKRRARKKQAARNDLTSEQIAFVLASKHGICDYCPYYKPGCVTCKRRKHRLTIDHVTPFAKQGDHTLWNVTACCASCNAKKKTNPPPCPVQPFLL